MDPHDSIQSEIEKRRLEKIKSVAKQLFFKVPQSNDFTFQESNTDSLQTITQNEVNQFFKENSADKNEVDKNEMIYLVSRYAYGLPSIDPVCSSKKTKSIESEYLEAGLSNEAISPLYSLREFSFTILPKLR